MLNFDSKSYFAEWNEKAPVKLIGKYVTLEVFEETLFGDVISKLSSTFEMTNA